MVTRIQCLRGLKNNICVGFGIHVFQSGARKARRLKKIDIQDTKAWQARVFNHVRIACPSSAEPQQI